MKPGFLLRYGKGTAKKTAKPAGFFPAHETDAQADSPENQSSCIDWRSPNASEADRIAAWALKMIRADLTGIIFVWIVFSLCLIGLPFCYNDPMKVELIVFSVFFIPMTFTQVRAGLIALRLKKQVSGIDYLISDAVAVTADTPGFLVRYG